MAELEKFIPLKDAAQKYGLQMHVLTDLVEKGKLRAVRINHTVAVAEGEVFEFVKETNGNGKKYAKLEGKPIRLARAADKYQISPAALSCWAKRGQSTRSSASEMNLGVSSHSYLGADTGSGRSPSRL